MKVKSKLFGEMLETFNPGDLVCTVEVRNRVDDGTWEVNVTVGTTLKVDRASHVKGWIFDNNKRGQELAERMKACCDANKLFLGYQLKTDVDGETYLSVETNGAFFRNYINGSLKALGF